MSWTVEIRAADRLMISRFEGAVDYDDFTRWLDETPRIAGYSRDYDGFMDLSRAIYKQARPEKVEALAAHMIESDFTHGRWAVLVNGPTQTALSLHYKKKAAAKHPMQVFSTVEAAAQFLNRNVEQLSAPAH